jgi:hypothetical protein
MTAAFGCILSEQIAGREIKATGYSDSLQEAVDMAVSNFLGDRK